MHPVYNAMNKPNYIFGVHKSVFLLALGSAALMIEFSPTPLVGLCSGALIYAVMCVAGRIATRHDDKLIEIACKSAKYARLYDSAAR